MKIFLELLSYLVAPVLLLIAAFSHGSEVLLLYLFAQFIFILAYFCIGMGLAYIASEEYPYFKFLVTEIAGYIMRRSRVVVFYWATELSYLLFSKLYFLSIVTAVGAIMCCVFCGIMCKSALNMNSTSDSV